MNLGIGADGRLAVLAGVGEERLVALDAERLLVAQYVAVAGQVEVAVEAGEHGRVRLHRVRTLRHRPPTADVTTTTTTTTSSSSSSLLSVARPASTNITSNYYMRLCIVLRVFFDVCDVSGCGFGAGLRPPLGSSEAGVASSVKGDDLAIFII